MKPVMTGTVTIFLIANKQVLKRWLKVQVLNGKFNMFLCLKSRTIFAK